MTLFRYLKKFSVPWIEKSFPFIRHRAILLRKNDCLTLNDLLQSGFSLKDSMDILEEKANAKCFQEIRTHLEQGEELPMFFPSYCPVQYRGYLEGFLRYMIFEDAFATSLSIVEQEEKQRKELVKGMLYPVLLFLGTCAGIWLFNKLVLPSMVSLLAGFSMDTTKYQWMQRIVNVLSVGILFVVLVCVIGVCRLLSRKHLIRTYQLVARYLPNSIFVQYASCQFIRFFLECEKRSISTNQTLHILSSIDQKPLTAYIASQLDTALRVGMGFQKAMECTSVERSLLQFFRIAGYTTRTQQMLVGYLEMSKMRTSHQIQLFSRIVQLFSYSMIGCILILVYQILMMPMSMLQNI